MDEWRERLDTARAITRSELCRHIREKNSQRLARYPLRQESAFLKNAAKEMFLDFLDSILEPVDRRRKFVSIDDEVGENRVPISNVEPAVLPDVFGDIDPLDRDLVNRAIAHLPDVQGSTLAALLLATAARAQGGGLAKALGARRGPDGRIEISGRVLDRLCRGLAMQYETLPDMPRGGAESVFDELAFRRAFIVMPARPEA